MEFKERLEAALNLRKMSPAELSRKTGIYEGTISQYRKGLYKASQENLKKISKALNVPVEWLLGADIDLTAKVVKIPVLGVIRAGVPIEAIEEILDFEEIPAAMAASGKFYGLRVKGSSMAPRISEGDIVIVRQQCTVESGSVAIVLVNGSEATVKEVQLEDQGISLVPWNVAFRPKFFNKKQVQSLPVQIIGKVVEIRGKLE